MCKPSKNLVTRRSLIQGHSLLPTHEAYQSSTIWLSQASSAAEQLHPLILWDVKNGKRAVLANLLQKKKKKLL